MTIHQQAISHLDRAVQLRSEGGYDSLRFATLELRYAIECLAYQLRPYYKDELSDEVMEAWRPQEIIDALFDCNPSLKQTVTISMALNDEQGDARQWFSLGTRVAIVPKVLRAAWHRLGSFLHAPPDGGTHDLEDLQRSVNQVIKVLEPYRGSSTIDGFAERASVTCECGRTIVRRTEALKRNAFVVCPSRNCHGVYEYVRSEGRVAQFNAVKRPFICPSCKETSYFQAGQIREGVGLNCAHCSRTWLLEAALVPRSLDRAAPAG
jgi:acetone carboxylase gamma subunit